MNERFGIHMGNSTTCLSVLKDGKIDIVASKFGDRCSYAIISAANENELIIGLSAKQGLARNRSTTIINNLQFLKDKLTNNEFQEALKNCTCTVNQEPLVYHLFNDEFERKITPYEVAVKLFANLYENASQIAKSEGNHELVLAVPFYFTQKDRSNIMSAARQSGFRIMQVISEPAAALLAYEIGFEPTSSSFNTTVMVYRLGGFTCDVSIFNVENGLYEMVDFMHTPIGGNLLNTALADYMAAQFYQKYKLDPHESRRTMTKIEQNAEACKHVLSTLPSAHVFIESLMDGIDWSQNISRARFESIITVQLGQFVRPMEELCAKHSNLSIDKIILHGGSVKIPKLKSIIASLYPLAELLDTIPGDEVISIGSARQAQFIEKSSEIIGDSIDMDVMTIVDGIFINDPINNSQKCLFAKGTVVPSEQRIIMPITNGKISMELQQGKMHKIDLIEQHYDNTIGSSDTQEIHSKLFLINNNDDANEHSDETVARTTDKNCKINFIFSDINERLIL